MKMSLFMCNDEHTTDILNSITDENTGHTSYRDYKVVVVGQVS